MTTLDERIDEWEKGKRIEDLRDDFVFQETPNFRSDFLEDKKGGTTARKLIYGGIAAGVIAAIGALGYHGYKQGWFDDLLDGDGGDGPSKYKALEKMDMDEDGIRDRFILDLDKDGVRDAELRLEHDSDGSVTSAEYKKGNNVLKLNETGMFYEYPQDLSNVPYPSKEYRDIAILSKDGDYFLEGKITAENPTENVKEIQAMQIVPKKYRRYFGNVTSSLEPSIKVDDMGLLVWRLEDMQPGESREITYTLPLAVSDVDVNLNRSVDEFVDYHKATAKDLGAEPVMKYQGTNYKESWWGFDVDEDGTQDIRVEEERNATTDELIERTMKIGSLIGDRWEQYYLKVTKPKYDGEMNTKQLWNAYEDGKPILTVGDYESNGKINSITRRKYVDDKDINFVFLDKDEDGKWDEKHVKSYGLGASALDKNMDEKYEKWSISDEPPKGGGWYDTTGDGKPDLFRTGWYYEEVEDYEFDDDGDLRPDRWAKWDGSYYPDRDIDVYKLAQEKGTYNTTQPEWLVKNWINLIETTES